jgi:hypothetical protein
MEIQNTVNCFSTRRETVVGMNDLEKAAGEFEGLLVGQVLKAGLQSSWDDDQEQSPLLEYAAELVARDLGQSGVFGISKTLSAALAVRKDVS